MTKRILSVVLSFVLALTMIPSLAFAASIGIKPTIDGNGLVNWTKIADGDKTGDFTVEAHKTIESVSTEKNWIKVDNVVSPVSGDENEGFSSKIDLTQIEEDYVVKMIIRHTKSGTSIETKPVRGRKVVKPPVASDTVNTPEVVLDKQYGDSSLNIVSGLKVTITPNIASGQPADYYDVTLYNNTVAVSEDIVTVPSTAKAIYTQSVKADKDKSVSVVFNDSYYSGNPNNFYFVKVVARSNSSSIKSNTQYKKCDKPSNSAQVESNIVSSVNGTVVTSTYNGIGANKPYNAYAEVYQAKSSAPFAKTSVIRGKADSAGNTTVKFNLDQYVFVNDNVYVKVYFETNDKLAYDEVAPFFFKANRTGPSASFSASMSNLGMITIDTKNSKADSYKYNVRYKGKLVKENATTSAANGLIPREEWGVGLKDAPAATDRNITDYTVELIGSKYNFSDYKVTLYTNGQSSSDLSIYGTVNIILPIAKAYNTASVNLVNLKPVQSHNNLKYVWYLENVPVSYNAVYHISPSDIGKNLSVVVIGSQGFRGSVESEKVFLDGGRPYIKTQPVGYKHYIGDAKQPLTVTATTTGSTLKYQWYKDGVAITGATYPTYTPTTEERGKDEYYCIISNTDGTVMTDRVVVQNLVRVGVPELKATKYKYSIALKWTAADNAIKYKVYERKGGKYKCIKTTKNTNLVVKVRPGSKHVYKIKAINGGCYSYSKAKKFTAKR